jgi:hypothetical protein
LPGIEEYLLHLRKVDLPNHKSSHRKGGAFRLARSEASTAHFDMLTCWEGVEAAVRFATTGMKVRRNREQGGRSVDDDDEKKLMSADSGSRAFPRSRGPGSLWCPCQPVSASGLEALQFLERSREMAAELVTAAPRPVDAWAGERFLS